MAADSDPSYLSTGSLAMTPRLDNYKRDSSEDTAMRLYFLNARIAASYFGPLGVAEVTLRNSLDSFLSTQFGDWWWEDENLHLHVSVTGGIKEATRRYKNKLHRRHLPCADSDLDPDEIIADTGFGVWRSLLHDANNDILWRNQAYAHEVFPHTHLGIRAIRNTVEKVYDLRNRVAHHKRIYHLNHEAQIKAIIDLIGYIDPDLARFVAENAEMIDTTAVETKIDFLENGHCTI